MVKIKKMSSPGAVLFRVLIVAFLSSMVVSCKKGDTGPAGPAGTANVIYSKWFTPGTYTKDTVFGMYQFYFNDTASLITQKALDSGVVITFGKLDGYTTAIWPTNQVAEMPITITYMEGSTVYNDLWSALATPGNLRIQFIDDHNLYNGISNAHQFRYVIIPGGVSTANASVKPGLQTGNGALPSASDIDAVRKNFQQMSYGEICQRLNIPL